MLTYHVQVFAATILIMTALSSPAGPFICHGDVCNMGSQVQFCHPEHEMCWNCEDIRDKCAHQNPPQNCTSYCVGIGVQKELKKEREKPCQPLGDIPNGDHNGSAEPQYSSGTMIVITCHTEFHIAGHSQTVCGDFGNWSQALPTCEPNDNVAMCSSVATIILAVVSTASILGHLIWCISWCRSKRKERNPGRNRLESLDEIETTKKLIERKDGQDKDALLKNGTPLKTMLTPEGISGKGGKLSESITATEALTSNKEQAARPNGVETTEVKSGYQVQNPAQNLIGDRCRPEQVHSNSSVTLASQPNNVFLYNHGSPQESGPVSCPLVANTGRRQPFSSLDEMLPAETASRLSLPIVTTNGVQPTSTKFAGAVCPPVANDKFAVVTEIVHNPEENGDYKKAKFAVNGRNIHRGDIKNKL